MIWRKREPEQADPREVLLAALGAVTDIPVPATGFWCYGLRGHDGVTFYVGQSANLLTRLGHWHKVYGDALAAIWLVRCANEWDMSITEDFLIARLKPAVNVRGTSDELARIRDRVLNRNQARGRAMGLALHESRAAEG